MRAVSPIAELHLLYLLLKLKAKKPFIDVFKLFQRAVFLKKMVEKLTKHLIILQKNNPNRGSNF